MRNFSIAQLDLHCLLINRLQKSRAELSMDFNCRANDRVPFVFEDQVRHHCLRSTKGTKNTKREIGLPRSLFPYLLPSPILPSCTSWPFVEIFCSIGALEYSFDLVHRNAARVDP